MKTHASALISIAALLALMGCATPDPRLGPDSRSGYVSAVYTAEKLRTDPPRCLASLTPTQITAGQYVEIKVLHGRLSEYLSAFVPPSIKPAIHDKVEISPQYCKDGMVPEVKQILQGVSP
jgi:hypothetical protein